MNDVEPQRISVIIPAKNSARTIGKCLSSIFNQSLKPIEVIVVDGGSKDDTRKIAENHGARVLVEPPHRGNAPGIARNYGAKKAKGELLAFLDADCYPEKTWLARVAEILGNEKVGIYGVIVSDKNGNIMSRAYHYLHMQISYDFAPSRCMAARREIFWRVGGFDETLTSGEDNDFSYRVRELGYNILVDKEMKVYHDDEHLTSLMGIWHQQKWYFEAEREFRGRLPRKFRRLKTSAPLKEHITPLVKALWIGGLNFATACLVIKLMSIRRHL
ncbi:MAG: glycosyltransferase [Candidatus Bathycorpusculaceae bacterium]